MQCAPYPILYGASMRGKRTIGNNSLHNIGSGTTHDRHCCTHRVTNRTYASLWCPLPGISDSPQKVVNFAVTEGYRLPYNSSMPIILKTKHVVTRTPQLRTCPQYVRT